MDQPKHYYLPPTRSIALGAMLLLVGTGFFFMGIDLKDTLWANLQRAFISFNDLPDFLLSLLMLVFKAGFIAGGYLYIKYADGVERARIDDEGFYYREIPKGSGMNKMGMDIGPLTFTPYKTIHNISYTKSFWRGGQLTLTLNSGSIPLIALGVLKDVEKREIATILQSRILKQSPSTNKHKVNKRMQQLSK